MANPTISQIKIGTTTYDICDFALRNTLTGATIFYKIDRSVDQQSISGANSLTVTWNGNTTPTLSDKTFMSYLDFNLGTIYVYAFEFSQDYIKVAHIRGSGYTTTFTPTAAQLWATVTNHSF